MTTDAPYAPLIIRLSDTTVGHLLAWEMIEADGSWHAWVSWVQDAGGRPLHKIVQVRAALPVRRPERLVLGAVFVSSIGHDPAGKSAG